MSRIWSVYSMNYAQIPFCLAIEGHEEFEPKKLTNLNEPNFSQLSLINGSLK